MKRADAITRVIADRVAQLRSSAGLTQVQLGERMGGLRPGWTRSTVVKLENYNREAVSVSDLLALARALDVPPVWLLADPAEMAIAPSTGESGQNPWSLILWMMGRQPLNNDAGSGGWEKAAMPLRLAWQAAAIAGELAERLQFRRIGFQYTVVDDDGPHDQQDAEVAALSDRRSLDRLVALLDAIREGGYVALPLPDSVITRARELGVNLSGVER